MRRPRLIAEQARDAKGLLGRLVAFIMARETFAENMRAIDALDVQPHDHVVDVGCGPGRSLEVLATRASMGRIVGADPSELMAEIAVDRNRRQVKARKVDVSIARVDALPFADGAFHKALCVHVIYFCENLDAALREIARVLKPGGCLALAFRSDADQASVRAFPAEIYRFRPVAEVIATLADAGFGVVERRTEPSREPVLLIATKSGASGRAQ